MPRGRGRRRRLHRALRQLELGQRHPPGRRPRGRLRREQRHRRLPRRCCTSRSSRDAGSRARTTRRRGRRSSSTGGWRGRSSATRTRSARSSRRSAIPNARRRTRSDKPEIKRVIGVVEEFRQNGELSATGNYLFYRMRLDGPDPKAALPERLFVRLRPGTTAAFEETLVKRAMAVADAWSFEVAAARRHARATSCAQYTMPLVVVGTIAGVPAADGRARPDRRGLAERHAADSRVRPAPRQGRDDRERARRRSSPRWSIMTSLALRRRRAAGRAAAAAAAARRTCRSCPRRCSSPASRISAAAIYLLTLACGWYPSRLATRIQPAEALRYE